MVTVKNTVKKKKTKQDYIPQAIQLKCNWKVAWHKQISKSTTLKT
jgi:hypothetical protein